MASFKAGFIQGVRTTNRKLHKHIKVVSQTVGNFSDANKAHDIAQEMYNKKLTSFFKQQVKVDKVYSKQLRKSIKLDL